MELDLEINDLEKNERKMFERNAESSNCLVKF